MRAATAVSLLITVGVKRVPLDVSDSPHKLEGDILILYITRDERNSCEFSLLQQCVGRRRDKVTIDTRGKDKSASSAPSWSDSMRHTLHQ